VTGADLSRSSRRFVAIAVLCLVASACSGGSKHGGAKTTTANGVSSKQSALKIGTVDVESAGPAVSVDKGTQKSVLQAAQQYVDNAMIAPLSTGKLGSGYDALFDQGVRLGATTTDANTLTDTGVGQATSFTEKPTSVTLSALADTSGAFLYLATNFTVNVDATLPSGPATIARTVELTFAQSGKSWSVTAYRVRTLRKLPTGTTTTAANAGGAK
jgi:hypothetical protein